LPGCFSKIYLSKHKDKSINIKKDQRFITPASQGTMGYALPASNGSAVFSANKDTICITGDGSLMTNIHDLSVTSYNKLNVKIFLINKRQFLEKTRYLINLQSKN
jgi:acetolactate synthase-1/2/3 large subunit